MTDKGILDIPMDPKRNDAGASTIKEYLKALLIAVWTQQEGFSGKRPFGNSSWSYDLYIPLIRAGLIKGKIDEVNGWIDECDDNKTADEIILKAIQSL